MDALKYGWSGLYGGSSGSSAAVAASTANAIGSSGGGSQADIDAERKAGKAIGVGA